MCMKYMHECVLVHVTASHARMTALMMISEYVPFSRSTCVCKFVTTYIHTYIICMGVCDVDQEEFSKKHLDEKIAC